MPIDELVVLCFPTAQVRHNARVGTDIAIQLATLESSPSSTPLPRTTSTATSRSAPPTSQHDHNIAASKNTTAEKQHIDSTSPRHRPPSPVAADKDTPATAKPPHEQHVRPSRVAVFGGAVVDIVARPRQGSILAPGTSTPGEARQNYGGVGRNVAEALARLLGLGRSGLSGPEPVGKNATGENAGGWSMPNLPRSVFVSGSVFVTSSVVDTVAVVVWVGEVTK